MRKLFITLLSLGSLLFFAPQAWASGEFQADYDVSYAVSPTGTTIVTERITLTNKQTNLYPKQYSVTIDTEKISDVIARDDGGVISPEIKQGEGKTQILLTFNQKIVGLGRQLTFTLRFQNQEIAQHNGNIWEINIPGVTADPDLSSYSVSLEVPPSFGPNAYMSPLPTAGRKWTKEQLQTGGVSAAYGTKQMFLVNLEYFLENARVSPVTSEIALPPDTAFQKVKILSLEPRPSTVRRDPDGNWLAEYGLLPATEARVKAKLLVETFVSKRENFSQALPDRSVYTRPLVYWETADPKIAALAKSYKTTQAIYNYVVNTLTYSYDRVGGNPIRKGAAEALSSPDQAICMEFTDLFIALARAAGIPAREVIGFAYTTNPRLRPLSLVADVLHSWPEYYDEGQQIWIPVDPTWGNTTGGINYYDKLDFNHLVFAYHGVSSTSPYPAGFYRELAKTGKSVNVAFTSESIGNSPGKLSSRIDFPKTVTAGFMASGAVIVENTGGVAVDETTLSIQAAPFPFSFTTTETGLPPFSRLSFPVRFPVGSLLTSGAGQISATVNGQTQNYYFSVQPMYWLLVPISAFVAGLLFLTWLLLVKLRLWKKRRS